MGKIHSHVFISGNIKCHVTPHEIISTTADYGECLATREDPIFLAVVFMRSLQ